MGDDEISLFPVTHETFTGYVLRRSIHSRQSTRSILPVSMSGEINSGYGMDKEKRLRTTGRHFRAFTSSYGWCTFGGCMQRISFAWTMGLVSLALSGVLWLLFIPWISRDLYRWGWGPIERVSDDPVVVLVMVSACTTSGM